MATASLVSVTKEKNFPVCEITMEEIIKTKLSWSRSKWEETGEKDSSMHKLINSLRYWGKKLRNAQAENNIIITLFNESKDAYMKMLNVIDAILALDGKIDITGFTDFRNPRYLAIYFKTVDMKNYVEKHLKKVEEDSVIFLNWAYETNVHSVRAHWVPMHIETRKVKNILGKYFNLKDELREEVLLMSGINLASGMISFKGELIEGASLEAVPHIIEVDGLECLVTVYGREPMCLTCEKIGHRSSNCPTPFCNKCRRLHAKGDQCLRSNARNQTYAQKAKGIEGDNNLEARLDGYGMQIVEQTSIVEITEKAGDKKEAVKMEQERLKEFWKGGKKEEKQNWADATGGNEQSLSDNEYLSSEEEEGGQDASTGQEIKDVVYAHLESTEGNVLSKMSEYFKELQELAVPVVEVKGAVKKQFLEEKSEGNKGRRQVEELDFSKVFSKKKIKSSKISPERSRSSTRIRSRTGGRKNYGRSTTGHNQDRASNMFDALVDQNNSE